MKDDIPDNLNKVEAKVANKDKALFLNKIFFFDYYKAIFKFGLKNKVTDENIKTLCKVMNIKPT